MEPSATSPKAVTRLPLLDALRGIAAIAVVFHHEPGLYGSHGLFPRAYLAVDFFFMLSGFVLTLAFEPKFRDGLTADRFLIQRFARLWPVLAVGIVIAGAGQWWAHGGMRPLVLTALGLLLISDFRGRWGIYPLDGPQWSVTFEIIANALHVSVLWRMSDRAVLGFALVCGVLLAALGWHFGTLGIGDIVPNWWSGFARVGFSYALGVWLGRQFAAGRGRIALGRWGWIAGLPVPLVLLTAGWWPLASPMADMIAVFVIFPPALWVAAQGTMSGIAARAADALGRLSYPVYAIHVPVLVVGARIAHSHPAQLDAIRGATLIATFALAGALAISPLARGIPVRFRKARG